MGNNQRKHCTTFTALWPAPLLKGFCMDHFLMTKLFGDDDLKAKITKIYGLWMIVDDYE